MFLVVSPALAVDDMAISLYDDWDQLTSERLMQIGENYRNEMLKPDSALLCFSIVANRYYQGQQSIGDIDCAIEAMTHIAWLYLQDFYDYPKAVSYNLRAQELAQKHQRYDYMPYILDNSANIRELTGAFDQNQDFDQEALNIHKQAFAMALRQENWRALYASFINLAMRTSFIGREGLIEKELNVIKDLHPDEMVTHFKFARCLADGIQAKYNHWLDSAILCFIRLQDYSSEFTNHREQATSRIIANDFLFLCYSEKGDHEKALATAKANESLAKQSNLQLHLLDAYMNQAGIYEFLNDEEMAEHYRMLYLESEVEMLTSHRLGSANEAKFLYELNQKNEEVREIAYREQMKNRMFWGALIFATLLLALLVLLFINYRKVQKQNRQLYNKSLEMIRADEEKRELIDRLQENSDAEPQDQDKRKSSSMDEDKMSDLLHRVFLVMETSDEIYSPEFSLPRLSELVGDKRNNVSEVINQRYKTNFNGLLNEYRIKEACRRINDTAKYGNLTIEAIGQSVGFKSRSAFSTIFKQVVGLTPSAYMRQARVQ
jgi:AraC-like DNA-binding protein